MDVATAYIIRVADLEASEKRSANCAESCDKVGQKWEYWDAYNGVGEKLEVSLHHNVIMDCIKVTDHYLTRAE